MTTPLTRHTGHLVEGMNCSKERPTVPGAYWKKHPEFGIGVVNFNQFMDSDVYGKPVGEYSDSYEWSGPIPLPSEATAQAYYMADEVDELLDEVASTMAVLTELVPDIGKLSKVRYLLDRLKGGV